jgi:uncharacterized protein YdeI (YjbR/CyaY-like superfamily)
MTSETMPADFAVWMDPELRELFDGLPDRQRRRYLEPIRQAAEPETREWRIAAAIQALRERSSRC